jgi:NosR/NirI family nitrous oxide reductase transcriptional regulator
VRRLTLSVSEINSAFEKSDNKDAAAHPEDGKPEDTFIDLYAALVTPPVIGKSLLGDPCTTGCRSA